MTVGHLGAGFKAAGSITLNWQSKVPTTYRSTASCARVGRQVLVRQQKERATLPDPSNGTPKEGEP